jgi:hypothetical protein
MKTTVMKVIVLGIALGLSTGPALAKKAGSGASKGDYRSAKSGKYVKKSYAEKNKNTTVREERSKK